MRGRQRLLRSVTITVLAVAGLAACGSEDGREASPTTTDRPGTTAPVDDGSDTPTTLVRTDAVAIEGYVFRPAAVAVAPGTTVTWTNGDDFAHSVVARPAEGGVPFTSPDIGKGGAFAHTFDRPGTFDYICGIHNYMTGTVTVA